MTEQTLTADLAALVESLMEITRAIRAAKEELDARLARIEQRLDALEGNRMRASGLNP